MSALAARDLDAAVALLAQHQHGPVHRDQLFVLGMSKDAVDRRVRRRVLRPIFPCVYGVGHLGFLGRARAALLWAGSDALICHWTAVVLWGLLDESEGPIHVMRARAGREPDGIRLHQVRALPERQTRKGLPVTTVPRLLLDLAETEPPLIVRRILGEALFRKRTAVPQIVRELDASPGRKGHAVLKRLLPTADATHSDVERQFRELVDKAGLPAPVMNPRVAGYKVDAHWEAHKVIVELDTFGSHGDHLAFEDDHRRDTALKRAGYTVVRFTDVQIQQEPLQVIATLAAALYSAASSHQ